MRTLPVAHDSGPKPAELDRAEGMLVLVMMAVMVPTLLGGTLHTLAGEAVAPAGTPGALLRPVLSATAAMVRLGGMGVLALLAVFCLGAAVAYCRRGDGSVPERPGWAAGEAYAAGAAAALLGLYWLA